MIAYGRCLVCGDRHLLSCPSCGAPLHYRRGDGRPWDAHGSSHHQCTALPELWRDAECSCGAVVLISESGSKIDSATEHPHRCADRRARATRPSRPPAVLSMPAPLPRSQETETTTISPTRIWSLDGRD